MLRSGEPPDGPTNEIPTAALRSGSDARERGIARQTYRAAKRTPSTSLRPDRLASRKISFTSCTATVIFATAAIGRVALPTHEPRARILCGNSSALRSRAPNASFPCRRPTKKTGIFNKDGNIDQTKLDEYRVDIKKLAAEYPNGQIPKSKFMALLKQKDALDSLTKKQWSSTFRLLNRVNEKDAKSKDTITPQNFDDLYNGSFLTTGFEKYANDEVLAKLANTAPAPGGKCPVAHG